MRFRDLSLRFAAVLLLLSVAGCGRDTFLGSRVDNFTAYYNTFYNAREAYDRGQKGIQTKDEVVDRAVFLPIFPGASGTGGKDFDDAIKKSADVIREHPGSKWVDDAALLIGKSYFYKRNFVGAQQKFEELAGLDTELRDEALFWLARTFIASQAYDAAADHIQASLNRTDVGRRWVAMLQLAAGELQVQRRDYAAAAAALQTGLEENVDPEVGARAQFLLGQVLETLGRYEEAAQAFAAVSRFKPRYELGYAAQVSALRLDGVHGDLKGALQRLRRMERDDKHLAHAAELAYLRGRIYQARGRSDDAFDTFEGLLYFDDVPLGTVQGRLHYALAELYRDAYGDFVRAAAHFDTARTQLRTGAGTTRGGVAQGKARDRDRTAEAFDDPEAQATLFADFARVRQDIARMDSLLVLGVMEEEAFAARILELRRELAATLAERRRAAERQQALDRFAEVSGSTAGTPRQETAVQQANSDAGFLFHKDPLRVEEGRLSFYQTWGERPRMPHWRRRAAITAAPTAATEGGLRDTRSDRPGVAASTTEDALPLLDYSDVPRDSVRQAAMRATRALARYGLGNVLFLSMNRPDTAAAWYRLVIEEDADQPVAQRAFYALAEVQRTLGDTAAAQRLYRQVVRDYPESDFAAQARERLGMDGKPARADSSAAAQSAYDAAYAQWKQQRYAPALDSMAHVAARYRRSAVAPRALLAAGTVYLEWAATDSLDRFAPLPLTLPDTLLRAAGLLIAVDLPTPPKVAAAATAPPDTLSAPIPPGGGVVRPAESGGDPAPTRDADGPRRNPPPGGDLNPTTERPVILSGAPDPLVDDSTTTARLRTAAADTLVVWRTVTVEELFMLLEARYKGTPYAKRAAGMRRAVAELNPSSRPVGPAALPGDTTITPATAPPNVVKDAQIRVDDAVAGRGGDGGAAREISRTEGLTVPAERSALDEAELARLEAGEIGAAEERDPQAAERLRLQKAYPALFGDGPVLKEAGGWTIGVLVQSEAGMAERGRAGFIEQGYRTGILVTGEGRALRYRVVLGHFATEAEAQRAQGFLAGRLPVKTELLALAPEPETVAPGTPDAAGTGEQSPALFGETAPEAIPGSWTIVVGTFEAEDAALPERDIYAGLGFRAGVWPGAALGRTDAFVLVVGTFAAQAEAAAALEGHRSFFAAAAEIAEVSPKE